MRHVVVTGGGTGIGLVVAAEFSEAGDQVTITGRREHVLKQAVAGLGGRAAYACFDASDPAVVTAALPRLPGRVDVLVNNAGGNTDFGGSGGRPPGEQSDRDPVPPGDLAALAAQWRSNLDANLLSAVLVTAALTPRFVEGADRVPEFHRRAARPPMAPRRRHSRPGPPTWRRNSGRAGSPPTPSPPVSPRAASSSAAPSPVSGGSASSTRLSSSGRGPPPTSPPSWRSSPPRRRGHVTGQVIHVNGGAYLGR